MSLTEDNYIEQINSYSISDWKPLLELIPEIERSKKNEELIQRFLEIVYAIPIVIVFDWSTWEEGKKMFNDLSFDFNQVDIPTKCKLITAIVRSDRFNDTALDYAFEYDQILKILQSIENQLNDSHL